MTPLPHQGLHRNHCLLLGMQRVGGLMRQVPHQSKGLPPDPPFLQADEGRAVLHGLLVRQRQFPILQETILTAALPRGHPAARRLPPWLLTWMRTQAAALRLPPAGATSIIPSGCHVQHCHRSPMASLRAPPLRLEAGQRASPGLAVPGGGCFPGGP